MTSSTPSSRVSLSDKPSSRFPVQGVLIINADDWGRDRETTDRILECVLHGAVSSASAMVFMEDSQRAASLAREHGVDTGLHLNFTSPYTARDCPPQLAEHQQSIASYLLRHRLAQIVFHPGLRRSFQYVVSSQVGEYRRLYGTGPLRLDGHHHMHLCANVIFGKLLPEGTIVRRNFSFQSGEKSVVNRWYRRFIDRRLARHHRLTNFLFSLPPIEPAGRLEKIFSLAREFAVELETHPVHPREYAFLTGGELCDLTRDLSVAPRFALPENGRFSESQR